MATRLNTAERHAILALLDAYAGGTLELRTGAQPATADTASSGTIIATPPIPNPAFAAAASGSRAKAGTWQATAVASGTIGWGRLISSDGTRRRDVSVSVAGGGGDLIIDTANVVAGGTVTVSGYTVNQPAG